MRIHLLCFKTLSQDDYRKLVCSGVSSVERAVMSLELSAQMVIQVDHGKTAQLSN